MGPPPRGNEKVYIFSASDGWARNFVKRHNIHTVRTQASPSAALPSASPSAASASPSAASASPSAASPSAAADMEDESMEDEPSAAAVATSSTIGTINTIRYEEGGVEWNI